MPNKKGHILAAVSGIATALAFPMFDIWPLAWFSLVPFLAAISRKDRYQALLIGMTWGMAFNLFLLYWIPVPITVYGKLPMPLGIILLIILSLYLSLFPAIFSYTAAYMRERLGVSLILSIPFMWVSLELVGTYMLTGFPWGILGYSQHLNLPTIQIADLFGVYGVSFIIVSFNCGLYRAYEKRYVDGGSIIGSKSLWTGIVLLILSILYGYYRLESGVESGRLIRTAVVQGNIDQDQKWDDAFREETMRRYIRLTQEASEKGVDLVVWPETAVPFYFQNDEVSASAVLDLAASSHSYLLFGSPAYRMKGGSVRYLNSAYLISPDKRIIDRYDKMHLVPFGEYVPLKWLLPFVDKMVEGIGDFTPGEKITILQAGDAKVGTLICYEGVFPDLTRRSVKEGANLLVNITNDAWFGRTSAPYQHLAMYSLRAVENRRPVIRAANTGVSAFIDSRGRVMSRTDVFREDSLIGEVRSEERDTVYTRFGDIFAYASLLISGGMLLLSYRRGSRPTSNPSLGGVKE